MTLQQLKYIIEIVSAGSISEAAKKLFISQPSLSNAVKELETEIGIEIFIRTPKGINLSADGTEFMSYARQVTEQAELLEQRYKHKKPSKKLFAVSTQHYAFAVNAFVDLTKLIDSDEYELNLRETRTYEIIEDVKNLQSEIGILYLNNFNKKIITKLLKESGLIFHPIFNAQPHVFISNTNPLSDKKSVNLNDLKDYPYLSFEQGQYNSFYFSEEILSTVSHKKAIHVSDRATLFNLLRGLDGYTISSGIISRKLNDDNIIAIPLDTDETMLIGWISNTKINLSSFAEEYIKILKNIITCYGYDILT